MRLPTPSSSKPFNAELKDSVNTRTCMDTSQNLKKSTRSAETKITPPIAATQDGAASLRPFLRLRQFTPKTNTHFHTT